jgi:hypothetical protein
MRVVVSGIPSGMHAHLCLSVGRLPLRRYTSEFSCAVVKQSVSNPPYVSLQRRAGQPFILLCYSNELVLCAVGAAHLLRLFADLGNVHEGTHEHSKVCLSNCPFMS